MTLSIPPDGLDGEAPKSPVPIDETTQKDQKVLDLDDHFITVADCCNAIGRVVVGRVNPETDEVDLVVFCGHHYLIHEPSLVGKGFDTLDTADDWKWVLK